LRCSLNSIAIRLAACFGSPISATALTKGSRESRSRGNPLEAIEVAEDLLAGRRVRRRQRPEAQHQVRRDQRVLGRVVVVERALAYACLGGDGVDADRADPLRIKQLVGGREDALGGGCHGGFAKHRSVVHRSVLVCSSEPL
jgi:hypothetical protein